MDQNQENWNQFEIIMMDFSINIFDCIAEVRESNNNVTIVSGYWMIKSKHSLSDYTSWFTNTMKINAPTVFYYDNLEVKNFVSKFRNDLPILFVNRSIESMNTKFKYNSTWIHSMHVPTHEVALIWLDKVYMMVDALKSNYFKTDWFAWIDAGIARYRNTPPPSDIWPSNLDLFHSLPHDKIIYTGTEKMDFHEFAGTAFMYHKSISVEVSEEFILSYQHCLKLKLEEHMYHCGSDQVVFTLLLDRKPALFHKIGMGYGDLVSLLYK